MFLVVCEARHGRCTNFTLQSYAKLWYFAKHSTSKSMRFKKHYTSASFQRHLLTPASAPTRSSLSTVAPTPPYPLIIKPKDLFIAQKAPFSRSVTKSSCVYCAHSLFYAYFCRVKMANFRRHNKKRKITNHLINNKHEKD